MSTVPKNLTFYGIDQGSAFIQWFSTGADTNYADVLCYDITDPSTIVFSGQNIYTPNTQYYSTQILGLSPNKTYVCYMHAKYDQAGTGESALVKSANFKTLTDNSRVPTTGKSVQQLIYVKTNVAGYFFDAYFQVTHTSSATVTEHPVETGASISDHSFINPAVLEMQIGMTDVATSIIDGQFNSPGTSSRSVAAFLILDELMRQRVPLQVVTRLKVYQNMLITSISAPDDHLTLYGLKATVTFKEIFVAVVKTVKISARPQTTDSTKKGNVEPVKPDQSILKSLGEELYNTFKGGPVS